MRGYLFVILCIVAFFVKLNGTSKILIYSPTMSYSHVNFVGRLGDVLVQGGHDVVSEIFLCVCVCYYSSANF